MIQLKNERQLQGIRESCRMLAAVMNEARDNIEAGIETAELDSLIHKKITKLGGKPSFLNYLDFPAAACISVNEVVIHGIPDRYVLKNGDVVSVDCGIEYNGFYSDMAFTLPVGTVPEEVSQLLKVTEECLYLGIEQCRKGNRIHDISKAIYRHAKDNNFGVVRDYCGHGVGFSQHEDPQVPNYISRGANPRLKSGMVLALEPMITLGADQVVVLDDGWSVVPADRSISAHFEHTVAILPDSAEILTKID